MQGCPLSPYLFIICTQGLSTLVRQNDRDGHIKGISCVKNGPKVSHLLFVDDSLLFCRAPIAEVLQVKKKCCKSMRNL